MFLEQFADLFQGRSDVYAEGYPHPDNPEKLGYRPVYGTLTTEVLKDHINGVHTIGVYPIVDNQVKWFAIDFDAPKDPVEDPFDAAWEAAKKQMEVLTREGFNVYLERSRSGKGVHLWGFFDEMVDAGLVRDWLKPLLLDEETDDEETLDRVFPAQSIVGPGKLGSLIALPFSGAVREQGFSSFLDPETKEVIPPRTWIDDVKVNAVVVLRQVAQNGPQTIASTTEVGNGTDSGLRPKHLLSGGLKVISPYGCKFMRHCWTERRTLGEPLWYAAIQQATCFRNGREFAHAISRGYAPDGRPAYDPSTIDAKFDQALNNPPVGCTWIHENYPNLACDSCPMKAPYHLAKRGVLALVGDAAAPMEHVGSIAADLDRIKRFDAHELEAGLEWGIPGLDRYTRLRPGEMTVVGALPSMGKTHLLVDAAYRLAKADVPVFVFSAETGRQSLRQRLIGRAAEVDTRALRGERAAGKLTSAEWARLHKAVTEIEKLPIYLDYTSLAADSVLEQVEDAVLRFGIPLDAPYVLIFDYLQFGSKIGDDRTEYDRVSRLSTEFKFTGKILEKPVVVFSQLIRQAEGDYEPNLTWFKNSGRIEADMDVGIIITGDRVEGSRAPRTMHIVKQREGLSNVRIEFDLEQAFSRYDERHVLELKHESIFTESAGSFGA